MYRIGKKQNSALLTADGHEVVVFNKGQEALAQKICKLLNADEEINKISSSATLAYVKTAKVRCIAKWEKRIEKAKVGMKRWGNGYGQTYQLEINIYQEVVNDLKRV